MRSLLQYYLSWIRAKGICLSDSTAAFEIQSDDVLPGFVYDFEHQCKLYFGTNSTICKNTKVCSNYIHVLTSKNLRVSYKIANL
jgi:hypothetical protein